MVEIEGLKEGFLLEGLFYDNPSILKFWHAINFLSYCYLPIYSGFKNKQKERLT